MTKFILLFAFGLLMTATVSAQSKDAKISAAIQSVMNAQVLAWNAGDIEGFMKGYWKSDEMKFVSGDNVSRGWQAALDRYRKEIRFQSENGCADVFRLWKSASSRTTRQSSSAVGRWRVNKTLRKGSSRCFSANSKTAGKSSSTTLLNLTLSSGSGFRIIRASLNAARKR